MKTGLTPEYILRKSLCRKPHCGDDNPQVNARRAESEIENMGFADGYAEVGYADPKNGVLFANWNYFPGDVTSLLEKAGYAIEWSDEWTTCEGCNKAVRTSPDSYGWQPSCVMMNECEIVCIECLNGDAENYLQTLENNEKTALNVRFGIDPSKYGYTLLEDGFEAGWHPGQDSDPKTISKRLHKAGHKRLLFEIDSVGQFDMSFKVWEKADQVEIGLQN